MSLSHTIESFRASLIERLVEDDPEWRDMVESTYGEDYRYDALGLQFGLAKFIVHLETVVIRLKDGELEIPRWRADAQLLAYQYGSDVFDHEERVEAVREGEEIVYDYSALRVVPRSEGQSKLFLGFVESLPDLEVTNATNVLCIGSSGDIGISGLSYEALIDILSGAGHSGTMYLYDPEYNADHVYTYLTYEVHVYARAYCYKTHPHRDDGIVLVFEDVFVSNMSIGESKPITGVLSPVKKGRIPMGKSIFVTYVDSSGKHTLKAWTPTGKPAHSNHGLNVAYKSPHAIREVTGGGYFNRIGHDVYVSGSSLTYGPYDKVELPNLIPDLNVVVAPVHHGRAAYDPTWSLFTAYKRSRISTKYFGEFVPPHVVGYHISDQLLYSGHEKRLLYNVPVYSNGVAACCEAHARLAGISRVMRVSTNADPGSLLDQAFACIAKHHCSPFIGVGVAAIKQRLKAAAVQQMGMRDAVDQIVTSLKVPVVKVHRVLTSLIRYKEIAIRRDEVRMFMSDFSVCVCKDTARGRRCVFESDDRLKYYDPCDGKIYSNNGIEQLTPMHKKAYLMRASTRVMSNEYGVHDVMSVLLEMNLSWRMVMPYGIRGTGLYDVGINCIGAPLLLKTRRGGSVLKVPKGYMEIGRRRGFVVYANRSVRRKRKKKK